MGVVDEVDRWGGGARPTERYLADADDTSIATPTTAGDERVARVATLATAYPLPDASLAQRMCID